MKWPQDKKERIKWGAVIGLGTVLILLGVMQGIVAPLVRVRADRLTKLAKHEEDLRLARKEIAQQATLEEQNQAVMLRIREIADSALLKPVLGNYLLNATDIIEEQAKGLALIEVSVREIGFVEVPQPPDRTAPAFVKGYTARVTLECGFEGLVALLEGIERQNRFLCVSALSVHGQPQQDPERHNVTFDVQWPIWVDSKEATQRREAILGYGAGGGVTSAVEQAEGSVPVDAEPET